MEKFRNLFPKISETIWCSTNKKAHNTRTAQENIPAPFSVFKKLFHKFLGGYPRRAVVPVDTQETFGIPTRNIIRLFVAGEQSLEADVPKNINALI